MSPALRFARRELRAGARGFRVFISCLALGVAAFAAAGSTASAFRAGLAAQARTILGGDLAVSVEGRTLTATERDAVDRLGRTSDTVHVRAMAQGPGGRRHLAELRGVDGAFPLAGTVELDGAPDLRAAFAPRNGLPGAAVEPALLERLGLRRGDTVLVGDLRFSINATLLGEPDRLGRGFALAPGALVADRVLRRSDLLEPGGLFGETLHVVLRPGITLLDARRALAPLAAAGIRVRDDTDAAAGLREVIAQVRFFLGLIALASLLAGGIGVATAVDTFLIRRRPSIAVLKALGASGRTVRNTYALQIGALAVIGILLGLGAGAGAPFALGALFGRELPVPVLFAIYPAPLALAGAFGLLTAAAFGLGALARARATPPATLLRRAAPVRVGSIPERIAQSVAAVSGLALLVATAPTPIVAAGAVAVLAAAFSVLAAIARLAIAAAGRLRPHTHGALRLGLANLGGPGSAARTATPAIGLGVAVLASLLVLGGSLLAAVRVAAPRAAPSLVLTGIPDRSGAIVDAVMRDAIGPLTPANYRRVPLVTGRIVAVRGVPVEEVRIAGRGRWAYDADLGLLLIGTAPPDAGVIAGHWWPPDYAGPPLVAMDRNVAGAARLRVGDTITLSVLGRALVARIAALRRVEFGRFGASSAVVIDPAALAAAHPRAIAIARTPPAADPIIVRRLGAVLPDVDVISVREQLRAIGDEVAELAAAVRAAAGVAVAAGVLVLIGAVSATAAGRAREAAILKVLGAGRRTIVAAYAFEYGLVGLLAGAAGIVVGTGAAVPVVLLLFRTPWAPGWGVLLLLLALAVAFCVLAGLVGAAKALRIPPAAILRED